MALINTMRRQFAIYWAPDNATGPDRYGKPSLLSPVELKVRWEDTQKEFVDSQGTTRLSSARIFVGQDVEVGGYLKLGELVSGTLNDPIEEGDAYEIKSFSKSPDLKAKNFLRTVMV
jgi:hypothetical protein